jgi:hypothetical protein
MGQIVVRSGDGLERLARRYNTTPEALRAANPEVFARNPNAMIHPDQLLRAPAGVRPAPRVTPSEAARVGASLRPGAAPPARDNRATAPRRPRTNAFIGMVNAQGRRNYATLAANFSIRDREQVTILQRWLNAARPAGAPALEEDGDWGSQTREALHLHNVRFGVRTAASQLMSADTLITLRAEGLAAVGRLQHMPFHRAPPPPPSPGARTPVDQYIREIGAHLETRIQGSGLPRGFALVIAQSLQGQVHVETTNGTDIRTSRAGAQGILQVMPETARDIVSNFPANEAFLRRAGLIPANVQGREQVRTYISAHFTENRLNTYLAGLIMLDAAQLAQRRVGRRASSETLINYTRRLYHGGPNTAGWGQYNRRYPGAVQLAVRAMDRAGNLLRDV